MLRDVTAVIPHIPVRGTKLARAVQSVALQREPVAAVSVAVDVRREGSAATRNRALTAATTHWVAFLDDDDWWLPQHIETLLKHAEDSGADVIYAGCRVIDRNGATVPPRDEWGRFGEPFDPQLLRERSYIPVTSLVRTGLAKQALFGPPNDRTPYDDWGFYLRLLDLGALFSHVPEVTWVWSHHGKNTSGMSSRW